MNNLDDYISAAMKKNNFKSKRELCRTLGLSPNIITTYKNGSWPNDETMLKIADLADVNPAKAILDLNKWRAPDVAKSIYVQIENAISKGAQILGLALILSGLFAGNSFAQNTSGTYDLMSKTDYILSLLL